MSIRPSASRASRATAWRWFSRWSREVFGHEGKRLAVVEQLTNVVPVCPGHLLTGPDAGCFVESELGPLDVRGVVRFKQRSPISARVDVAEPNKP